jgi:Alcohol dehydrogenase GroES-like domain
MTESSMTAVVEYGPNQLKLESVPIPSAAANEVIIEVEACGVCTSDVKAWHGAPRYWGGNGQPKWIREPVVPGHEFIGHIVELGSEVEGLAGKIPVGGVGAIKDGLREVKSGNMVATNLQNAAIELGMALQATVDLLDNKQVPQTALLNMPVIKKDKVDYYYSQLYVKPQDFLKTLPELIKKNMASGDYASQ